MFVSTQAFCRLGIPFAQLLGGFPTCLLTMVSVCHSFVNINSWLLQRSWDAAVACMERLVVRCLLQRLLFFFLCGASDGATHISTPVIESILTYAVSETQSCSRGGVVPIECRSSALARDRVASTIKECVCDTRADLFIIIISSEPTSIVRTPYFEDPEGS